MFRKNIVSSMLHLEKSKFTDVVSEKTNNSMKRLIINGIRGLPAAHGGFETFAECLSLYLVKQGWEVIVYCQEESGEKTIEEWKGITLVKIPVSRKGSLGTIIFDFKSIIDSLKYRTTVLTLGYNTAIFNIIYRFFGIKNIINMDGIEWKRSKWSAPVKAWFYLNELIGSAVGHHLIADNPEIEKHLTRVRYNKHKITMIPYGADESHISNTDALESFGLKQNQYALVIARPEPENSILEIIASFSATDCDIKLVVLGNYNASDAYQASVLRAANDRVNFVGAIYDPAIVQTLRTYCRFYIHGHQVGGTNPSLVEALGCGSPVLAQGNRFNRWVLGESGLYFSDIVDLKQGIERYCVDDELVQSMREASLQRWQEKFTWPAVLAQYEGLLSEHAPQTT